MVDVVEGTITKVESYGLFADTPMGPAVVLLPDISRERITDLTGMYKPGDSVKLRLLFFAEDRDLYKASMLDIS